MEDENRPKEENHEKKEELKADPKEKKIGSESEDEEKKTLVDDGKVEAPRSSNNEQKTDETGKSASDDWKPKTELGKKVKTGEITDISQILNSHKQILEAEIVDLLVPNLETDLLMIGQSKGKFGGGQRRVFKQTQKKTREGNKPKFATIAIAGNHDGIIGMGYGKSKETVPAREKAIRNSKLNLINIRRGCGSWECGCKRSHSIPFKIEGKCSSVRIKLMPAPKGTGLRVERECQKILGLAGIKDVWSKTYGQTRTKINLIYACFEALKLLMDMKINEKIAENLGVSEGPTGDVEVTDEQQ